MWSSVQAVSQTPTRWEDLAPEPLSLTLHLLLTWENNTSEPPRLVEMFQGSFRCSVFNVSFKKYILNYSESQLFWSKNSRCSQMPSLLRCELEHNSGSWVIEDCPQDARGTVAKKNCDHLHLLMYALWDFSGRDP